MGEIQNQPFQPSFNASLKVDFQGSRLTSDGGLILVRELDERLGFGELIEQHLTDSRRGKNTQFPFANLLRQSVYSRRAIAFRGGQAYIGGRAGVHNGDSGSYPSGDLIWVQGALILYA
ncbi:MAG: transposase [Acidobacteriia bacterium]|nr:transposase [Terriglobia bacterium]